MQSNLAQILSKLILGGGLLYFLYLVPQLILKVQKRQITTDDGIYINHISRKKEIKVLALNLTKDCYTKICKVQNILNYVTNIPYKVNNFSAHSPQQTIAKNFGDCDDKSNLLISLLHELHIKSYFVLVPEHIFVVVQLPEIIQIQALYINDFPYYILESTAKNSQIGFPFQYKVNEISDIIEPFQNKKVHIKTIEYK